MRIVSYAGVTVVTTDRVAVTLLEVSAALARRGLAEAVRIPVFDETTGACHDADLVVGVGVQVLSVPAHWEGEDAPCEEDVAVLRRILERSGVTASIRSAVHYDRPLDDPDLGLGEEQADLRRPIPLRPRDRR